MAGQTTPDSWRTLRSLAGHLRKVIACQLGRQTGIVDKWFLQPPLDAASADSNGIPNPLDHILALYHIIYSDSPAHADQLLDWLCNQAGGKFIRPPQGQKAFLFDTDQAAVSLKIINTELWRKRDGKKYDPAKLARHRRHLQNLIDALGTEETV